MSFFGASAQPVVPAEAKDIEVTNLPADSISGLAFSPTQDLLAVASWSNEVRIYEVNAQGQTNGKAAYSHEAPALCVNWSKDGTKVISGGADKAARMLDVTTGQSSQIAVHDAPVKCIKWIDAPGQGLIATGSWDKTIKYWDLRSQNAVASVTLPERCYTLDVAYPLMVVGTAERHIQIFNLNQPTQVFKTLLSPLRWQTRVVTCFPDATGYAVGSIEGRVAMQHVDDKMATSNFSFKCHRKEAGAAARGSSLVYAVNDISFHPFGTFSTAGADGTINLWDKDSKTRLKTLENRGGPIGSTTFNASGSILAYSVTYDWSSGHAGNKLDHVNKVMLHACKDDEVKKRPKKS